MEKRKVPSFASFKPRQTATDSAVQSEQRHSDRSSIKCERVALDRDDAKRRRAHEHKRRRHGRHRDHSRDESGRHGHLEHRPRHERYYERSKPVTPPFETDCPDDSEYFLIDRRGDAKNVEYGGLHRYSIPPYHRVGYGTVLGARPPLRIDRDASTDKGIALRIDRGGGFDEDQRRLLTKKNAKLDGRDLQLILPKESSLSAAAESSADLNLDFLSFSRGLKRKREKESPGRQDSDRDYRSIEGEAKVDSQPKDEDLKFASDSDHFREITSSESLARKRNAELSRAAKADATEADAWLALVEHQVHNTFPDLDSNQLSSSQRCSIAEIRLSILAQALAQMRNGTRGYDRLLLEQINEGTKVWDTPKLSQKWQDVLAKNPGSALLWHGHLNYQQSNRSSFRYEHCMEAYLRCLQSLTKELIGLKDEKHVVMTHNIVYMLLRLTSFTRDAGYDELALAMWQAIRKYYPHNNRHMDQPFKLDTLADIWTGNKLSDGQAGVASKTTVVSNAETTSKNASAPFASFATAEASAAETFFLPVAADNHNEEEETADPFRYVMSDDVQPMIESLPGCLDHMLLIDAFLCFMGLPPVDQHHDYVRRWQVDPFLQTHCKPYGPGTTQAQRYDSFSLFFEGFSNHSFDKASAFVTHYLSNMVEIHPDNERLGEYLLAFVNQTNPANAARTARRLLKTRPTSLRYYNAYALKEACTLASGERLAKAEQIWKKALELSRSLEDGARDDTILLWHSWTISLVHGGDGQGALRNLLAMSDTPAMQDNDEHVHTGAVLKVKRALEEAIDHMTLKRKTDLAALYADCLAWLLYLSSDHKVESALQSFTASAIKLPKSEDRSSLELLHQAKARILAVHIAAKRPFRPILFRDVLAESIRLFPENGALVKQYYEVAKLTRLDDRLRDAMNDAHSATSSSPQGLVSWHSAIHAEVARCSVDGASATKESVRALFRCALLAPDSNVKCSLQLWKQWLDFEFFGLQHLPHWDDARRSDIVRSAKEVFFNGLRFLPWCKRWAIDGMAAFAKSGDMSENELMQIHDMLADTELRTRVDVDDLMMNHD